LHAALDALTGCPVIDSASAAFPNVRSGDPVHQPADGISSSAIPDSHADV